MNILFKNIKKLRDKTGASLFYCKKALLNNENDFNKALDYINKYGLKKKFNVVNQELNEGLILDKIICLNGNHYLGCLIELGCETDFVSKNQDFYIASMRILNFVLKHKIFNLNLLNKKLKSFLTLLTNRFGEKIKITKLYYLVGNTITSYNHNQKIGVLTSFIKTTNTNPVNKQIAMHIAAKKPKFFSYLNISPLLIKKAYEEALFLAQKTVKYNHIQQKIVYSRLSEWLKEICFLKQEFIFYKNLILEKVLKEHNICIDHSIRIELGKNNFNQL